MSKELTKEEIEKKKAYNREYSRKYWRTHPRTEEQKLRNKESVKRFQEKNRDKVKQYRHDFYMAHKEKAREQQRRWTNKNREHVKTRSRINYEKNIEHRRAESRRRTEFLKRRVIKEYGGVCACCGESRFEFLTIDHIGGRKKHGHSKTMSGRVLYQWLRRNGFPKDGFRLLCANCNCAHGFYGYCPHERERQSQVAD